jgi:hypothetical protein
MNRFVKLLFISCYLFYLNSASGQEKDVTEAVKVSDSIPLTIPEVMKLFMNM